MVEEYIKQKFIRTDTDSLTSYTKDLYSSIVFSRIDVRTSNEGNKNGVKYVSRIEQCF
jgi:hypothetical protein